jgi:hypothetical protein
MPDDRDNLPIDPPDNQGGGNATATGTATGVDSASNSTDEAPIDPPDNQGGGNQ